MENHEKEIQERLADHTVRETFDVRTFRINRHHINKRYLPALMKEKATFSYNSNWAYSITWRPGSLFLAGDLGEMTITHYNAMPSFERTIGWLCGSDFQYLMGKSDKRRKYDAEETYKTLLSFLNEPVLDAALGHSFGREARRGGLKQEFFAARQEAKREFDPDFDEDVYIWDQFWSIEKREKSEYRSHDTILEFFDIPDHWLLWVRAHLYVEGYKDWGLWKFSSPERVLTASHRAYLRYELEDFCQDQSCFVDVAHYIGLDDFYGCESYSWHDRAQYECIQFWAKEMRRRLASEQHLEAAE